MKKVVSTNTTEDTSEISVDENKRSINIGTQPTMLQVLGHPSRTNFRLFRSLFNDTIFIAALISGLFFGLIQESTAAPLVASGEDVTTTYSGAWTANSAKFSRGLSESAQHFYYQPIEVSVSMEGTYTFTSRSPINTFGYIYDDTFDCNDPTLNLISQDDDSDGNGQFRITALLHPGRRYILVATTVSPETTGEFSIISSGPIAVEIHSKIESRAMSNKADIATKTEYSWIYSGALSSSSQVFYRPYGSKINYYYLQAIEVSVSTSGTYIFASNSSIDTVGYLYTSPFDPSNPLSNLITNDDDSGDISYQFEIEAYLLPGRPYVLVVTTHSPVITGRFAISAVGPAPVILTSIMASTSRPITTLSTPFTVSSSYSGALSSSSQGFSRPDGDDDDDDYYFLQAIQVSVTTSGTYVFMSESDIDTFGYFYDSPFDPSNPSSNLITENDDGGDMIHQFRISANLQSGRTYVLVVTTHAPSITGSFEVSARGPASLGLTSIMASTSRPIVTPSTAPPISVSYTGGLTTSSPMFYRPQSLFNDLHYFQAIVVTVPTAGIYILKSISSIDTRGYFYRNSFDPSNATANLITDDDDSGGQLQFLIRANLEPGNTYILVVTTHREYVTGNFSVNVAGPALASLTSITPSTSRPIITPTTAPPPTSSYAGELSTTSQIFYRPQSPTNSLHYFQAIQITVPTAGAYTLRSISSLDTRGYFYRDSFDPSNSTANLITDDDDSGGQLQFLIRVDLQPGNTYILVVTTHRANVTGNFTVNVAGPALASLTSITPSTSRPIITPSTAPPPTSYYAGQLSTSSAVFYRPQSSTNSLHYFQAIQVTVPTAGTYSLRSISSIDTRGYFYRNSFDPSTPSVNLLTDDDDSGGQFQFLIRANLEPGNTYILVVTTHRENVTGNYSVSVAGPALASLTSITPSTSQPITAQTTVPPVSSAYAGELLTGGPMFYRPQSFSNNLHYFQAIQVTVPTAGTFTFRSISSLDTRGYFYRGSFDPSNATANLVTDDDDSGGQLQFLIRANLEPGNTYILVVTTHRENITGNYSVNVVGPAPVSLTSITPSTSRPIITPSTAPPPTSSYVGELSASSPIFIRPQSFSNTPHYFQAIQITVPTAGAYTLRSISSLDTRGYFYRDSFDPSTPSVNLLTDDDDSGGQQQFLIRVDLQPGNTYILVVTTHRENITGNYSINVAGPALASLTSITPSTSRPIITPSTAPPPTSSYVGELSTSSSIFHRPQSVTNSVYYFQAIQVTVPTAGTYSLRSISSIDTRGYLYRDAFDPSNATANLITYDDDSGGQQQFLIRANLEPGNTYILVVTTFREYVTGNYSVSVSGSALASLTSITPSTSQPIIAPTTLASVLSSFPGELSTTSAIFYRPGSTTDSFHYFQAIQVTVPTAGTYTLRSISAIDTRGYFYRNSFDPSTPSVNLFTDDDDSGGQQQFLIRVNLEPGNTYVLVVTTHREAVTGNFSVTAVGPDLASLTSITPSTSQPLVAPTTMPSVSSSYTGELSTVGQSFSRPGDSIQRQFYYQAIQVTVSTAATYILRSNSSIDTRGYFYRTYFNPYDPATNLITEDDDGGGSLQFRIQVRLELGQTYILVVTTHNEKVTGSYSVSAVGPGPVDFVSFIAVSTTSTTTTTTTTVPTLVATYAASLLPNSPVFRRPYGDPKDYFYQAIRLDVTMSATYFFTSYYYTDLVCYLYETSFDSLNPLTNLINYNVNSGPDAVFLINATLQSGVTYIVVVTKTQAFTTGGVWLSVGGPYLVNLTPILTPTSATTTTTQATDEPTQNTIRTTLGYSASVRTSEITTATICLLILSTLRMFQQCLF